MTESAPRSWPIADVTRREGINVVAVQLRSDDPQWSIGIGPSLAAAWSLGSDEELASAAIAIARAYEGGGHAAAPIELDAQTRLEGVTLGDITLGGTTLDEALSLLRAGHRPPEP
jgi:hypothetical protein